MEFQLRQKLLRNCGENVHYIKALDNVVLHVIDQNYIGEIL